MANIKRLSPGVYEVDGKRVNAATEADAVKQAGGGQVNNAGAGKNKQGKPQGAPPILPPNTKIKNVSQGVEASRDVAQAEADANINLNNPNITNDFGSQNVTRNADGSINVDQSLSSDQKAILDKGSNLTKIGQDLATQQLQGGGYNQSWAPNTIGRTTEGDFEADRRRIEDAVYNRLTGRTEQRYGQEKENLKQELFNRGVPLEEIAKHPEMQNFEERFENVRSGARDSAVTMGGDEWSRTHGINEQTIANQFSQQQATRNQGLSEVGALQGYGTGLQVPNFQPFQGAQVNYADPNDIQNQQQLLKNQGKELNAAIKKLNSGGGTPRPAGPAAPASPFNNSLPPGYS